MLALTVIVSDGWRWNKAEQWKRMPEPVAVGDFFLAYADCLADPIQPACMDPFQLCIAALVYDPDLHRAYTFIHSLSAPLLQRKRNHFLKYSTSYIAHIPFFSVEHPFLQGPDISLEPPFVSFSMIPTRPLIFLSALW